MGVGSHLSPKNLIFSSFSTLHLSSNMRNSRAAKILFQSKEWCPIVLASRKFPSLQYFSHNIVVTRDLGWVISRQSCFARRPLLKHFKSLNPHQNLFNIPTNSLHKALWRKKTLKETLVVLEGQLWCLFLFPFGKRIYASN